jgi:hypothetical protein
MTERYKGGRRRRNLKRRRNGRFASRAREAGANPIGAGANPLLEAAENPMSAAEYFIGGGSMIIGGLVAEVADRFAATHALTMVAKPFNPTGPNTATTDATQAATDPNGKIIYMDVPDAGAATMWSPYNGMKNGAAIAAPMGLKRWIVAGAVVVVPFVGGIPLAKYGHYKSAAFFNFLGFGAAVRTGVKSLGDLLAFALKGTGFGQRIYDGEARAQALKAGAGAEQYLPSTGLGRANVKGVAGCGDGCCGGCGPCKQKAAAQQQPPSTQQQPPSQQQQPPPPPPPPTVVQVQPPGGQQVPVPVQPGGGGQGVPVPVQPGGGIPVPLPGQPQLNPRPVIPPSSALRGAGVGVVVPRAFRDGSWARNDHAAE